MKSNRAVKKIGARVIGAKKQETLGGRADNLRHKQRFRSGEVIANDPEGGNPTPPVRKGKQ
jgi:hypothetical protein